MHHATIKKIFTCLALALAAANASAQSTIKLQNVRVTQIILNPDSNYIFVHARDTQGNDNVFWIYNKGPTIATCAWADNEAARLKALELAEKYGLPINVQLAKLGHADLPPGYEDQYANQIFLKTTEQSFENTASQLTPGNSVSGQVVELAIQYLDTAPTLYIQDASGQVYDPLLNMDPCTPSGRHLREMAFKALEHAIPVKASISASYQQELDLVP